MPWMMSAGAPSRTSEDIYDDFVKALEAQGAYLANEEEAEKLKNVMWDETGRRSGPCRPR